MNFAFKMMNFVLKLMILGLCAGALRGLYNHEYRGERRRHAP